MTDVPSRANVGGVEFTTHAIAARVVPVFQDTQWLPSAPDGLPAPTTKLATGVHLSNVAWICGGSSLRGSRSKIVITEALVRRRRRDLPQFTVMSCDNIPGNGDAARRSFVAFAALRDPELGTWVEQQVRFPNSMVDRITPVTTDEDKAEVSQQFGIDDQWPVVCEPFTQWVLEDEFGDGRPPLEDIGVQLVDDVEPYELMKIRLLKASHQALSVTSPDTDWCTRCVKTRCSNSYSSGTWIGRRRGPCSPSPGSTSRNTSRRARFSNPNLRDTAARLCAESSDRILKWLLPVIRQNLATSEEIKRSAAIVASWARYAEGVDEQGRPIEVVDRLKDTLMANARRQRGDPLAFIADRQVFGNLIDDERFTTLYRASLASLYAHGARVTLKNLR